MPNSSLSRPTQIIIVLGIAAIAVLFFFWQTANATVGTLQLYQGSAEVLRGSKAVPAATGIAIRRKDQVHIAPDSRVAIVLKDGSIVRLEAGSQVVIKALSYRGQELREASFELEQGRLWSNVQPLPSSAKFSIETPSVIAAVHGTRFNTDYRDTTSQVYVAAGTVGVARLTQSANQTAVQSAQLFTIRNEQLDVDFATDPLPVPHDYIDDWIRFNLTEDDKGRVTATPDQSTTPTELKTTSPSPTAEPTTTPPVQTTKPSPTKTQPVSPKPTETSAIPVLEIPSSQLPTPSPSPSPSASPTITALTIQAAKTKLAIGDTTPLTAIATLSDGNSENITQQVAWTISPVLGMITNSTFTAQAAGTLTLSASLNGLVSNLLTVTIESPTPTVVSLRIACQPSGPNNFGAAPRTAQCSAHALMSDQSTVDVTEQTNWSLKKPVNGSISSAGFYTAGEVAGDTIIATHQNTTVSVSIDI